MTPLGSTVPRHEHCHHRACRRQCRHRLRGADRNGVGGDEATHRRPRGAPRRIGVAIQNLTPDLVDGLGTAAKCGVYFPSVPAGRLRNAPNSQAVRRSRLDDFGRLSSEERRQATSWRAAAARKARFCSILSSPGTRNNLAPGILFSPWNKEGPALLGR